MSGSKDTRGPTVLVIAYADTVLLTIAVALRFMARWISKAGIAIDDWWIFGGLLLSYGVVACAIVSKATLHALMQTWEIETS